MNPPLVRRIRADDAGGLRDLRLQALRSDPTAFASSYESEVTRPPDTWDTWAALASEGPDQAMFLAEADGTLIGMAGAYRTDRNPRSMHLIAMWVDPEHRRRGVGRALTNAVVAWARRSDVDEVSLWVVGRNDGARRLYEVCGFEATGESQPLPSNQDLVEDRMVMPMGTRLRMPDGYVDLDPMATPDIRAFLEWVIAERTARLMDGAALPFTEAADTARAQIAELLDTPPGASHRFFTLKAGIDPDPRGWLWFSERRREGTRIAVIEELVVFDDFRGRGLAASAVESAILHTEMAGITTIEASIPIGNHVARRIAESCGFSEIRHTDTSVTVHLVITPSDG